jgi:hypothetical protein
MLQPSGWPSCGGRPGSGTVSVSPTAVLGGLLALALILMAVLALALTRMFSRERARLVHAVVLAAGHPAAAAAVTPPEALMAIGASREARRRAVAERAPVLAVGDDG